MDSKVCSKCKERKPIEKFGIKRRETDGYRSCCKDCHKIAKRVYKKANKEKVNQYQKAYLKKYYLENKEKFSYSANRYKENKEKFVKRMRKYRLANKEKLAEQARQRYIANKDKFAEYQRLRYYANKEEFAERSKIYRSVNKEKVNEQKKKYRQSPQGKEARYKSDLKRRSNKHNVKFTPHKRKQILNRDKWTCKTCGCKIHDQSTGNWNTPNKAHIDHIIPVSKGGNSDLKNLRVLCRTCNLSKKDREDTQLQLKL